MTQPIASKQPLPHYAGTLAMWWFLAGLSMLFGASMVAYIVIRLQRSSDFEIGHLSLPWPLFVSTLVVLAASVTIQLAVVAARRERQTALQGYLGITLGLGLLFCAIQTPAMIQLLSDHAPALAPSETPQTVNRLYGVVFVFILLHALHVLGGIVHLIVVNVGALRGKYDHEFFAPVKHAAMYWHFLDVVWIVMFGTMIVLR